MKDEGAEGKSRFLEYFLQSPIGQAVYIDELFMGGTHDSESVLNKLSRDKTFIRGIMVRILLQDIIDYMGEDNIKDTMNATMIRSRIRRWLDEK